MHLFRGDHTHSARLDGREVSMHLSCFSTRARSDFWSTDGVFPNEAAIKLASRGASVHAVGLGEGKRIKTRKKCRVDMTKQNAD